jgi:hypothetical protein
MGPIGFPETSVRSYNSTLRKIPKRAQISFTPWQKPAMTQRNLLFLPLIDAQLLDCPAPSLVTIRTELPCTMFVIFKLP